MAFEILSSAYADVFKDLMSQRSPAGQAAILGKQLENKVLEQQLQDMFPLQVEKLQKEIDFMISEPEKQRLELEKAQFAANLEGKLAEAADKRRQAMETGLAELGGEQKLEQIDREWFYRLQEKKIPTQVHYSGGGSGRGAMSPMEFFQKAALSDKFKDEAVEAMEDHYNRTGEMDYSLLEKKDVTPRFGKVAAGELPNLKEKIIDSPSFELLMKESPAYKKKGVLGVGFGPNLLSGYKSEDLFDDIISGDIDVSKYPDLKQLTDSYRYSATGIPPGMPRENESEQAGEPLPPSPQQQIVVPQSFPSFEEFDKFVRQNALLLTEEQKAQLRAIRQQNKW